MTWFRIVGSFCAGATFFWLAMSHPVDPSRLWISAILAILGLVNLMIASHLLSDVRNEKPNAPILPKT